MAITVIIMTIVVLLDQGIKWVVSHGMELYQSIPVIPDFFHLTYLHNYGAGFSMLQGKRVFLLILTLAVALLVLAVLYWQRGKISKFYYVSMGFFLGGALGNFVDRLFLGYVVDYLSFIFGSYHFPVFNLADMAVSIGAVVTMIYILLWNPKFSNNPKDDEGKGEHGTKRNSGCG